MGIKMHFKDHFRAFWAILRHYIMHF